MAGEPDEQREHRGQIEKARQLVERRVLDHQLVLVVEAADLCREGITPGVIGVMGTAATLAMRLYQDRLGRLGWDCLIPGEGEMQRLVSPAIAAVKANRLAEAYAPLAEVVGSLARRGARAVVLGCTEIPLGIQAGPWQTLGVPVIDTIDALARASIAWARA